MTDLVLRDVEPMLLERIQRVSIARGWSREKTCVALLEQGLFSSELKAHGGFNSPETEVLSEAIAALKALPAGENV
jgi:hypothetical protein